MGKTTITDTVMYDRIGPDWYEQLEPFIESEEFAKLRSFLIDEAETKIIYPPANIAYEAFRLCPYEKTRVVILGQDPYHDGSANGLAFSTNGKVTPSMRVIQKAISRELETSYTLSPNLTSWANQGVLLLNTALTVREKTPGSHLHVWQGFTDAVIESLKQKSYIVWMLWGTSARNSVKDVPPDHNMIYTYHPMVEIYDNTKMFVPDFKLCNLYLAEQGFSEINWLFDYDDLPF